MEGLLSDLGNQGIWPAKEVTLKMFTAIMIQMSMGQ